MHSDVKKHRFALLFVAAKKGSGKKGVGVIIVCEGLQSLGQLRVGVIFVRVIMISRLGKNTPATFS